LIALKAVLPVENTDLAKNLEPALDQVELARA